MPLTSKIFSSIPLLTVQSSDTSLKHNGPFIIGPLCLSSIISCWLHVARTDIQTVCTTSIPVINQSLCWLLKILCSFHLVTIFSSYRPDLILLCFTLLSFADTELFIYKLEVCGNTASSKSISVIFPKALFLN